MHDKIDNQRYQQHLTMFIIDVLRHDVIEPLPSILRMLNNVGCIGWREFWPHDFMATEIIPELRKLTAMGFVRIFRENPVGSGYLPVEEDVSADEYESLWFE